MTKSKKNKTKLKLNLTVVRPQSRSFAPQDPELTPSPS
jgi:hypothetical protein